MVAFRDDEPRLPVVAAIEHDEDAPAVEPATKPVAVAGLARQVHPQHVHRRTEIAHRKSGAVANGGVSAIRTHGESRPHFKRPVRRVSPHTNDALAVANQVRHRGPHHEPEFRILLRVPGDEIEEIPLRHECDELALGGQVREVREWEIEAREIRIQPSHFLVRMPEEVVEQSQFVHNFERGRVDGVATKVAQEVRVLLQHNDIDAGTSEEEAEHHPGRPAACDTTLSLNNLRSCRHACSRLRTVGDPGNCTAVSLHARTSLRPVQGGFEELNQRWDQLRVQRQRRV